MLTAAAIQAAANFGGASFGLKQDVAISLSDLHVCGDSFTHSDRDAAAVKSRLDHLQHDRNNDCQQARYLVHRIPVPSNGLGSEMHRITVSLTLSFILNRTLLIPENLQEGAKRWIYAPKDLCGPDLTSFSCVFQSLSPRPACATGISAEAIAR
jgi:hypothetical protein